MCVIMMYAGIHEKLNTGLWPKYMATSIKLENIMVNPHEDKYAHEKFYRKCHTTQKT